MGGLVAVAVPATIIGGIAAGGVAIWNIFFKWLSSKNLTIHIGYMLIEFHVIFIRISWIFYIIFIISWDFLINVFYQKIINMSIFLIWNFVIFFYF